MPTRRTRQRTEELPRMGGVLEDVGSFLSSHSDDIASIAEVVVPVVAPWTAPVVAAEHALRTGKGLTTKDAKAATEGATAVGKAVAEHVADQAATGDPDAQRVVDQHKAGGDADVHPSAALIRASQTAAPAPSSSSNGLLVVGGIVLLLILAGEL